MMGEIAGEPAVDFLSDWDSIEFWFHLNFHADSGPKISNCDSKFIIF